MKKTLAVGVMAAMRLGRAIRWIESRRENLMAANHAREVSYDVEIGWASDGAITRSPGTPRI